MEQRALHQIRQLFRNITDISNRGWYGEALKNHEKNARDQFAFSCFPCGSAGKESTCHAGDLGLIPGLGRSPGEGKGYLLWPGECHGLPSPRGRRVGHDWMTSTFTVLSALLLQFLFQPWRSSKISFTGVDETWASHLELDCMDEHLVLSTPPPLALWLWAHVSKH